MSNAILIEGDDHAETALTVAGVARLISKIEPATLKEEIETVAEFISAIADATRDIADHLCDAHRRELDKDRKEDFFTLPEAETTASVQ